MVLMGLVYTFSHQQSAKSVIIGAHHLLDCFPAMKNPHCHNGSRKGHADLICICCGGTRFAEFLAGTRSLGEPHPRRGVYKCWKLCHLGFTVCHKRTAKELPANCEETAVCGHHSNVESYIIYGDILAMQVSWPQPSGIILAWPVGTSMAVDMPVQRAHDWNIANSCLL